MGPRCIGALPLCCILLDWMRYLALLDFSGAREHSVYQRWNFDPSCDWVHAYRDQIQQVLVNLFRNALKKAMVSSTHLCLKKQSRRCHD